MWTYNNTLCHHGIKGQKWGVRRYQNPDGSLTDAGEKRARRQAMVDKAFTKSIKNGKDKEPISPAEKMLKDANNAMDRASRISNSVQNIKADKERKKRNSGISSMTDEELRSAVNRMNLERQYKSLSDEKISAGMSHVNETLNIVGSAVGITASVVGIVTAMKGLRTP